MEIMQKRALAIASIELSYWIELCKEQSLDPVGQIGPDGWAPVRAQILAQVLEPRAVGPRV